MRRVMLLTMTLGCTSALDEPSSITYFDSQEAWLDPDVETTESEVEETESESETESEPTDTDTGVLLDESGCTADVDIDEGNDGDVDATEFWEYDDDAQLIRYEKYDADGNLTESWSGTYGGDGLEREEEDHDGDGDADLIRETTWDSAGRIEQIQTDQGGDGDVDLVETYTYADPTKDLPERREWTGSTAGYDVYEWQEDVGGKHADISRYEGDGEDPVTLISAEYDATHGLVYLLEDTDADGTYDVWRHWTHNDHSNLIVSIRDRVYVDGSLIEEVITGYARDPQGFIMTLAIEGNDASGTVDDLHTYTWDCPE